MTVGPLAVGHVHRASSRVIVPVSAIAWRGGLEKPLEVGQQQRLVLVDDDGRRRVKRLDVEDAKADARVGDEPLEAVGQVDELGRMSGRETDSGVAAGRNGPPSRYRASACQGVSISIDVLHAEASVVGGRESSAIRERCVRCS